MNPCTGVDGVCPPLCKWSELEDGTYTLLHVLRFNEVLEEMVSAKTAAIKAAT